VFHVGCDALQQLLVVDIVADMCSVQCVQLVQLLFFAAIAAALSRKPMGPCSSDINCGFVEVHTCTLLVWAVPSRYSSALPS
jgi:hypothetical protein